MTGDCDVQGNCVSSNNYPAVHGNGEFCEVTMLQTADLTAGSTFNIETCCDHLIIQGEDIEDSTAIPVSLEAGETFSWSTDSSVTAEGWQICFSQSNGNQGK